MSESENSWNLLEQWFPELSPEIWQQLKEYTALLREWNEKINLVSRKDMDRLETKHLAHCLTITNILRLMPKAQILDVGTGGGLPGIPLAICYPQARFTLLDSIGKKVMVVEDMVQRLGFKKCGNSPGSSRGITQKEEPMTLSSDVRLPHYPHSSVG